MKTIQQKREDLALGYMSHLAMAQTYRNQALKLDEQGLEYETLLKPLNEYCVANDLPTASEILDAGALVEDILCEFIKKYEVLEEVWTLRNVTVGNMSMSVPAWCHKIARWNSYVIPFFPIESAAKLIKMFTEGNEFGATESMEFSQCEGRIYYMDTETSKREAEVFPLEQRAINGGIIEGFSIKGMDWCWVEEAESPVVTKAEPATLDQFLIGQQFSTIFKVGDLTIDSIGDIRHQNSSVLATLPPHVVKAFRDDERCVIRWDREDIFDKARDDGNFLTHEEITKVIQHMNNGISWETIDVYIDDMITKRS